MKFRLGRSISKGVTRFVYMCFFNSGCYDSFRGEEGACHGDLFPAFRGTE